MHMIPKMVPATRRGMVWEVMRNSEMCCCDRSKVLPACEQHTGRNASHTIAIVPALSRMIGPAGPKNIVRPGYRYCKLDGCLHRNNPACSRPVFNPKLTDYARHAPYGDRFARSRKNARFGMGLGEAKITRHVTVPHFGWLILLFFGGEIELGN